MSDHNRQGGADISKKGYNPASVGNGYQPAPRLVPSRIGNPGAGHQPTGTGARPALPSTGSGVKPPPQKK